MSLKRKENHFLQQLLAHLIHQCSDDTQNIGVGSFQKASEHGNLLIGKLMDVIRPAVMVTLGFDIFEREK